MKVHVTQVCEWKSNLFVPKSNDIHFAQPFSFSAQTQDSFPIHSNVPNSIMKLPNDWQAESAIKNTISTDGQQQQQKSAAPTATTTSNGFLESSIVYESPSLLHNNNNNNNQQHPSQQQQQQTHNLNANDRQLVNNNNNNILNVRQTIESNTDKALVLALPIEFSQQFAGFEPGKYLP